MAEIAAFLARYARQAGSVEIVGFGLTNSTQRSARKKVPIVAASDYPTCKATYVTLRIYPETLDPSAVTARLGIEPSSWQRRGEGRRPGFPPARLHGWFLSSEGVVDSCDVREHLDWLLARVGVKGEAIDALQAAGCRMDVSCYWLSMSGHGGPTLTPRQMGELARLNLELWFDVYLGDIEGAEQAAESVE